MVLTFSHRKAVQALNFFAREAGGTINKMKALKLIYFADRFHLRKFARPITCDAYFAMPFGPVASGCRDLVSESDAFLAPREKQYREQYLESFSKYTFSSKSSVDFKVFSQSDLEALRFSQLQYGSSEGFDLSKETHDFPEWKRHEAVLNSNQASRCPMHYGDFFDNPELGVDKMPPLDRETANLLKEEIAELGALSQVWC